MRLIQITAKRIQNFSADIAYILNLSENFNKILKDDYLLVVAENTEGQGGGLNILNLNFKKTFNNLNLIFYYTYLRYFFWFPYFYLRQKSKKDIVFFSNDVNLILILIFWKIFFRAKYKICSDWHMVFKNKKEKLVIKYSDFVITTSDKLKKSIVEFGAVEERKVKVVYGGVDLGQYGSFDKIELRKKLNLPLDKKIVSYVGLFRTMGLDKGIETMMKSLKYLSEDVLMVFVGARYNEIEEYKAVAEKEGVLGKCVIMEKRPFEEVVWYEQASDVLVIPYPDKPHFRDYGFPMKVYEYMATGNPIVYSGLELSEEILGDCGFVYEPDNFKDLAEKIKLVIDKGNKEVVSKAVYVARKKLSNLDWVGKVNSIIDFIK